MKSQCLLATAASVRLSTTSAHAIVDLDGNGMSDVWQLIYGAYGLPASGDADGDGSTNLHEALWGTNPFNPLSRQPLLTLAKPNPNLGFSFPSVKGIRYQVQGTPNLGAVSWSDIDVPLTGTGNSLAGSVSGPFSDRYFLRLNSVASLDGENDGLNAFEEGLLGTNDTTALSDPDTLTDLQEFTGRFLYGLDLDPTKEFTIPGIRDGQGDDDHDGVSDQEELLGGSNPADPSSFPPGNPNIDSDRDSLPDAWEIQHFGSINAQDADGNPDGDRLNNRQEQKLNLNPNVVQTNGTREDGLSDSDGDNVIDLWELEDGTDPFSAASVDLATNFIVLQGLMEHRSAWGAVSDPLAQFSGLTLRAQAVGFEDAQPTTGTQTYGLKNDIVGITDQGGGNFSITRSMRFRKGVRYKVELLNPNNIFQMPFVSAKYNWVSGGNADEPTNTYFNYEVVNRQWYNRDPLDTVSPIVAIATDATLSPNPDPLNLHFTLKGAGTGGPDATTYPTGFLSLNPLQFIEAEGPTAGRVKKFLPIYTPNDGIGKGLPIYDTPRRDLELTDLTASNLTAKYFGTTYAMSVSGGNPNLYQNTAAGLSIEFLSTPLNDANVKESVEVRVNQPSTSIFNAYYVCAETTAASSEFRNEPHGLIATFNGLNSATVDSLRIQFSEVNTSGGVNLTETSAASQEFAGSNFTAKLVNGSAITGGADTIYLAITSPEGALVNTSFSLVETGNNSLIFRNYAPPIPTNATPSTPVGASFRLRTIARLGSPTNTPTMRIRFKPSAGGGNPGPWVNVSMTETSTAGVWESTEKLVLAPNDVTSIPGYVVIIALVAQIDFSNEQDEIEIDYGPAFATNNAQPEAVVLQSLPAQDETFSGLDPANRIKKPLEKMGYKVYDDYEAATNDAINSYAPGKQIWYSMSHGAVSEGATLFCTSIIGEFAGLSFKDSEQAGIIDASKLAAKNLNYRLVMAAGCASAQSSTINVDDARSQDGLLTGSLEFAQAWGPKVAYLGFGWCISPRLAEEQMSKILEFSSRQGNRDIARPIRSAFKRYRNDPEVNRKTGSDKLLLKLYVNGGFAGDEVIYIIDRKARNARQ